MAIQRDKITASAEKLVAKGKIEAAIREYERLIDENPGDVNTLNRIGDLWSRINRGDEAVKVFTKIADHYSKDGFFLKAIAIYKKINKLDPSKLDIYAKLAELYAKQGLSMEAKSQYQVLADFHLKQGDPAGALVAYKRISELDPNSINVSVKMADLYSQTGQTAQALEQYEKIGRSLLKRGMTEEAGQVYRKAVRLDPSNVSLAENAVQALSEAGDRKAAAEIVRATLEKSPGNPRLTARLGRLHLETGEIEKAREVLQSGLDANPTDVTIREALAELQLDEGDTAGAWRILAPVVDDAISRGDNAGATTTLEKIAARDPEHTEALSRLVKAYGRSGDRTRELSAMSRLSEAHTRRGDLEEALGIVDDLVIRDRANAAIHQSKARELRSRLGHAPSERDDLEISATVAPPVPSGFASSLELDLPPEPPMRVAPPPRPQPAAPAEGDEDINFVTEHLTEAEVFHKYGLTEKAVEHLSLIIARYPGNLTARERLVRVWMDERDAGEVARAATEYAALLRSNGDQSALETLAAELRSRNLDVVAASVEAMQTAPAPGASAPAPGPALPELDFGDDDDDAMTGSAERGMEIDLSDTSVELPEIEFDLDSPEFDVDLSDAPAAGSIPPVAQQEGDETIAAEPAGSQWGPEPGMPPGVEPEISFDTPPSMEPEISSESEITFELDADSEPEISFDAGTAEQPEISFEPEVPESEDDSAMTFSDSQPAEEIEFASESASGDSPETLPDPVSFPAADAGSDMPLDDSQTWDADTEDLEELPLVELNIEQAEPQPLSASSDSWGAVSMEELGEVDFYLEQELFDEARNRLETLEARAPGDPQLAPRRQRLDEATAAESAPAEISPLDIENELLSAIPGEGARMVEPKGSASPQPVAADDEAGLFDDEEGFFDLAAELEQELQDDDEEVSIGEEEQSLEEIFREFKKGVEQQLDSEDYETHYNLGIAYKEMGLTDEAIAEFQLASKDPRRTIECCSMLGICFLEKGMPQLAIKWYLKGLEAPDITQDENLGLLYDLGAAYLETGDVASAQKAFVDIYGVNSNYRDIADRLRDLEDVSR